MSRTRLLLLVCSAILRLASSEVCGADPSARLEVAVNHKGLATAHATVPNPHWRPAAAERSTELRLFLVLIPVERAENVEILTASDVRAAVLSDGRGYTLIGVLAPTSLRSVPLVIQQLRRLQEAPEGRAQIILAVSYPFLSAAERDLLKTPTAVWQWQVDFVFPQEHPETGVSCSPAKYFTRVDGRRYRLDEAIFQPGVATRAWIAFPFPGQETFKFAKLLLSLLVGSLATLFHLPAIRARRILWLLIALGISSGVLVLTGYFWLTLPRGFDFLLFAGAALPHAGLVLIACIYVLIANRYQANLSVHVRIDGADAEFADVRLIEESEDGWRMVKAIQQLDRGRYTFMIWAGASGGTYQVLASAKGAAELRSDAQHVVAGDRNALPTIELRRGGPSSNS